MFSLLDCNYCQSEQRKISLVLNMETCSEDPTKDTFSIKKMQYSVLSTSFDVSSATLLVVSCIFTFYVQVSIEKVTVHHFHL